MLAPGIGVEVAAHGLDLFGDVARAASLRALEGHVLEQVGDAVHLLALVPRAGIDPQADGGALQVGHGVGDDPEAVLECGDLYAHGAARSSVGTLGRDSFERI